MAQHTKNMISDDQITVLIDENRLADALLAINERIAFNADDDAAWYLRGKANWKLGNHSIAISDYEHASLLNPDSPARHALEMSRDILDYFNPDLLNP